MTKAVWTLLAAAALFWGICAVYPTSPIHVGWIGTLFASTAGLIATISSYLTEERVDARGGTIFRAESPIHFFIAYAVVGLLFLGLICMSIMGSVGRIAA